MPKAPRGARRCSPALREPRPTTHRHFAVIDALIAQIEEEDINQLDPMRAIAVLFRAAETSNADAYLLMAALVENIAGVIERRVPVEAKSVVSAEIVRLLSERLGSPI